VKFTDVRDVGKMLNLRGIGLRMMIIKKLKMLSSVAQKCTKIDKF